VPVLTIFVETHNGKTLDIALTRAAGETTVLDVKQKIQDMEGLPRSQQHLVFNGIALKNDEDTLQDCNIQDQSRLHLALRLRGGRSTRFHRTIAPPMGSNAVPTTASVRLYLRAEAHGDDWRWANGLSDAEEVAQTVHQVITLKVLRIRPTVRARLILPTPRVLRWRSDEIWTFLLALRCLNHESQVKLLPSCAKLLIMEYFALPCDAWEEAVGREITAKKQAGGFVATPPPASTEGGREGEWEPNSLYRVEIAIDQTRVQQLRKSDALERSGDGTGRTRLSHAEGWLGEYGRRYPEEGLYGLCGSYSFRTAAQGRGGEAGLSEAQPEGGARGAPAVEVDLLEFVF
jgi:hypothetical protein